MQNLPNNKSNSFPWVAITIGINALLLLLTMILSPGDISESVRESYLKTEPPWGKKISTKLEHLSSSISNLHTKIDSISQSTPQWDKIRNQVDAEMTPILQLVVGQIENLGKRVEEVAKKSKEMENAFSIQKK